MPGPSPHLLDPRSLQALTLSGSTLRAAVPRLPLTPFAPHSIVEKIVA